MRPVFKCDYCSKMGTEEEIKEHELKCTDNFSHERFNDHLGGKFGSQMWKEHFKFVRKFVTKNI